MARYPNRGAKTKSAVVEQEPEADKPALNAAQQIAESYRICFGTDAGLDVLEDLRKRFGSRRSFVPDSDATAFHEGQRDLYEFCRSMMERDRRRTDPPLTNEEILNA
jgi:hypothetical protein